MIDQLTTPLLGLLEIGGNRLLGLDQNALRHCTGLQGHIIAIRLTDLDRTLYFHPGSWGMRLSLQQPNRPPDATISGRLASLLSLGAQQDKITTSIQEGIEIAGNAGVAQKFQKILTELDIDWEEQLSSYIGDIAAFRIGEGLRKTRQWVEDSAQSLALSGREYLQEEARHLPTQPEFEAFRQDVTNLRHDVDRIEALIKQALENNA